MVARRKPARTAALPRAPLDARLMNAVAGVIALGFALVLAAFGVTWALRSPLFTVNAIQLDATLDKASLAGVRAQALPRLSGNFFALDLDAARAAFEQVPWVRRAVVRRVWPDRLAVTLEEHEPAAVWHGDGQRNDRLVNSHGEVFEVAPREIGRLELPTLAGGDDRSAQMLEMLQQLDRALAPIGAKVEQLRLSPRGSWHAELASGGKLELGRGSDEEVLARVERLVRTLDAVHARFGGAPRAIQSADLRHPDGYALRLAGITTADAASRSKP
jgi:cell division protein FtsQ